VAPTQVPTKSELIEGPELLSLLSSLLHDKMNRDRIVKITFFIIRIQDLFRLMEMHH